MQTYLWEFRVATGHDTEFRRHYGPGGTWAELFRRDAGFIETLLLEDAATPGRYLTLDRWQSSDAYRRFRAQFAVEYAELDRRCERLTASEALLGEFVDVDFA